LEFGARTNLETAFFAQCHRPRRHCSQDGLSSPPRWGRFFMHGWSQIARAPNGHLTFVKPATAARRILKAKTLTKKELPVARSARLMRA
jgi:hypothetical protein